MLSYCGRGILRNSSPSPTWTRATCPLAASYCRQPRTKNPHSDRPTSNPQNTITRISSPAGDLSNKSDVAPPIPSFLREGELSGRRSQVYFFVRDETPSPHGHTNLELSRAKRLSGNPWSSHASVNDPEARARNGTGR